MTDDRGALHPARRSDPPARPLPTRLGLLAALLVAALVAGCAADVREPGPQPGPDGGPGDPVADIAGLGAAGVRPVGEPDTGPVQAGGFPDAGGPTAHLTDVRSARQDGFDRIVLEFAGDEMPSYRVSYVEPPVRQDGSGHVVPIAGAAFLEMRMTPASGVDLSGEQPHETYPGPDRVAPPRGEVVTEVVRTGDFEAHLAWTAGVSQRLPFGVAAFADPLRLVVDVLHAPAPPGEGPRPVAEPGLADTSAEPAGPPPTVTDVRLGAHDGFDRIVFQTAGEGRAGYRVGYTEDPRSAGSGAPVGVPGAATLGITLTGIALPGDAPPGATPWDGPERQRIAGSQVLVELVEDTLFEGRYAFFAGLTGEQPFAVGRLDDPPRIVVDVLTDAAQEPIALSQRCQSPDGYAVSFPEGWSTGTNRPAGPCAWFAPEPFAVDPGTDERPAPIAASVEPVPYTEVTAPGSASERDRAATVVDGRQAVRIERVATGDGLYPEGTPSTGYAVDLGGGSGTLVLDAVGRSGTDHARDVDVLDRMVRTLDVTAGAPADERAVAAYLGGGGAFTVTARPRGNQVCLRIPPDGAESCVAPPAPDEVSTAPLTLLGDRQVLSGLAGSDVFRIRADRADAEPVEVLPAPVPGAEVRGFAFPLDPPQARELAWFDRAGNELGSR